MASSLEIPNVAQIIPGPGGLLRYEITTPLAHAHVYLHGAHVTRFVPTGEKPLLWMSTRSCFENGKPIRGGVPVIFPWFGARPNAPSHGFARTRSWTPESVTQEPDGAVILTLRLDDVQWVLRHRITIATALTMELQLENRSSAPFRYETAHHTYFQVSNVRQISVCGLENAEYYDNTAGMTRNPPAGEPIRFTGETDRVYPHTATACVIDDPGFSRRIRVEKEHAHSTIVWNPWTAKAAALPDFGDDEWPAMVCVESGNVGDDAQEIPSGTSQITRTRVSVEH